MADWKTILKIHFCFKCEIHHWIFEKIFWKNQKNFCSPSPARI